MRPQVNCASHQSELPLPFALWCRLQDTCSLAFLTCTHSLHALADTDTAAAYTAYVTYFASAKGSSDYDIYRTAQTTAANSLSAIITDLGSTKLTSSADSAALSSASTIAQQVITEQGVTPLPPPEVGSPAPLPACKQSIYNYIPCHQSHPLCPASFLS